MTERRTARDQARRFYDRISRAYDFIADSSDMQFGTLVSGRSGSPTASGCWRSDVGQVTGWSAWQTPLVRPVGFTESISLPE
jgi:hypothetical protein